MIEVLKTALSSPIGSFAFVFALMVLGGWLIFWVTKKVTQINAEHSGFKTTVDKMDKNIDDIRKDLSYVKGSIDLIKSINPGALYQSQSPITLTELGKQVAIEIKADDLIARNWGQIETKLDREISNKNAYDIQQYCLENISVEPELYFDTSGLNSLKNFAFNQGKPLQFYTRLLGIMIRDRYLERKGIAITDIDKHDPNPK